jgi:hypothetical protein
MNPNQPDPVGSTPNPELPKGFPTEPRPVSRPSTLAGVRSPGVTTPAPVSPEPKLDRPDTLASYKLPSLPEPEYEKPRRRRGGGMGCFRWLFNCRCIGCFLMFTIAFIVAGTAYVVINRPPAIWTPVKEWFNVSLAKQEYDERTYESVSARLNSELANFASGTNTLRISEQDLYAVLKERLKEMALNDLNVELRPGIVKLYWNIETDDSLPLWMVMESTPDNSGRLVISKMGMERLGVPDFLNDSLMNIMLSGIKLLQGADQNADLVRIAFPFKENIEIKSVEVNLDELVLHLDVKTGLEDFF